MMRGFARNELAENCEKENKISSMYFTNRDSISRTLQHGCKIWDYLSQVKLCFSCLCIDILVSF